MIFINFTAVFVLTSQILGILKIKKEREVRILLLK